ncbi:T9SS type A sorting domain-containing protein [Lacibacter luteus]|uniref:T9SS type A sorting domain-containing protein n=1 Tax=Lacibacter luteus TaxID=2508719 RepID=A0A4Q1CIV2_9BACT|nr:LamG-like jellyroll fold domain-containing protein [Lacibacter luteus]RXK60556.1 T9SS type A sorting domain-containing protein [Lacibacter luteus]
MMKRLLCIVLTMLSLYAFKAAAQAPALPTKGLLTETILTNKSFTNGTQTDTVLKQYPLSAAYTLEVIAKVNAATGRGLDLEARNSSLNGFRLSLDGSNLKWTAPLTSANALTLSPAAQDYTIRIAVKNDSAHIYQNGAYIQSQPLTAIKDIANGVETDGLSGTVAGPTLVPTWAGTTGNYTGKPSDYGWGYTGTSNTTLFATANSTTAGSSRYLDVTASSNAHTYAGLAYTGRVLYVRWDAPAIESTVYYYPVTLEANTTYDFSMLHAYVNNATGARTITAGIGKTTDVAGRYATHVFNTSGTADLKRESFVFTSQEAGTYYLTFTGDYGLYSIAELSLNKNLPSSFIPNWAGIAPNTAGRPSDYSWRYHGTTNTTLFSTANSTTAGTSRYMDVNASSGGNLHTLNGATYTGRLLFVRWDGSSIQNTVYRYPVLLEANTTYNFSMLHAYITNATGARTMTMGIGKDTSVAGRFATKVFTTTGTRALKKEDFAFTSQEAGVYWLTLTGNWGLFSIGELAINKIDVKPRFIFGKNYNNGAVDMQISSVTYEDGAYAPETIVTGTVQTTNVTGTTAWYLPNFNTNFVVAGKTELHLTGDYSPLVNSTVALNSNDAWLFFDNIKPSTVKANWLDKVTINGVSANNNPGVRVAIYKNGTVVIPNGALTSQAALEVFKEQNLEGDTRTFEIETYHNNLGEYNNSIRSFKLHRGYMATFANNADGSGYSRVFIANDSDLVVNAMPAGLDTTVSFIRVFRWDWISKKGKAGWSPAKVGATWYYDWNIGGGASSDYDYAIIRQNGGWPSFTDINNKKNVNHLLGFNEPDRPDQANMTVQQTVAQWPELMKSGLRVGSPAPANPESSWITDFLAKTDSLNYRVDYVAIHCYWGGQTPAQWYSRLRNIYNRVKRPLWITEWNNGANWTTETWPAETDAQLQKQLSDIKGILQVLDTASFIERYAIYDWVENKRAMVLADTLTPAGKYYYANKSDFAFNPKTAFVHNFKVVAPPLSSSINSDDYFKVTLSFKDLNAELGSKYILERKVDLVDADFLPVNEFTGYANASTLSFVDDVYDKATYRVKAFDYSGTQFAYSASLEVKRDVAPVAPTTVTGFALSSSIDSVKWNAGANARSYNVKRSLSASGPFEIVAARTTQLSLEDKNLQPSTTYYYVITSLNSAGESENSAVLEIRTKDLVAPESVLNPHIAGGDGKIILTWDFQYDAKYNITRASTANGSYETIATDVDSTRFEDERTNGTTWYYKVIAQNAAGNSPETAVLSAKPMLGRHAFISFNENTGTFAEDVWGGYQGTLAETATWTTGKTNSAAQFTGAATSYASLAYAPVNTLNDFTVATWVKMDAVSTWMRIFDFGTGTSKYMFLTPQSGVTSGKSNLRFAIKNGSTEQQVNYAHTWQLNTWTHIAVTLAGTTATMYVDGVEVASNTNFSIKPSDLGITNKNYIGKSQYNDPMLRGAVDEFKIFNHALTAAKIADAMKEEQAITFAAMPPIQIGAGDTDAGATATSGLPVNYHSSNSNVAVIVNGLVQIVGAGTTVITASQPGNEQYAAAISVAQTLTVNKLFYVDVDGDGFGSSTTAWFAVATAPNGYADNRLDCDDSKILYTDADGDGLGAGNPAACGVTNNTDCDDTNPIAVTASIPDVYAMNPAVDAKNTIYIGYGPTSLTITVQPQGGTAPYTYRWNTGETTQAKTVSSGGTYTVTVTDVKGCTVTVSAVIRTLNVECGNNSDKVMICHNGSSICVAASSVDSHLKHGDKLGACDAEPVTARNINEEQQVPAVAKLSVYPNPVSDQLRIILPAQVTFAALRLYNANGALVFTGSLVSTNNLVSVKQLPAGMYYYHVQSADGKLIGTGKLVKQ